MNKIFSLALLAALFGMTWTLPDDNGDDVECRPICMTWTLPDDNGGDIYRGSFDPFVI